MKDGFKEYPREYEYVLTNEEEMRKIWKIEHVSFLGDIPENVAIYRMYFDKTAKELFSFLFEIAVKLVWLRRRLLYKGIRYQWASLGGKKMSGRTVLRDFLRVHVGFDINSLFSMKYNESLLAQMEISIPHLIQDIDERNPFKEKIIFPYENINFGHYYLVHAMDEWRELLDIAEKRKMTYAEFGDYIINYIHCYNYEHGDKYKVVASKYAPLTIHNLKKWEKRKERTKELKEEKKEKENNQLIKNELDSIYGE